MSGETDSLLHTKLKRRLLELPAGCTADYTAQELRLIVERHYAERDAATRRDAMLDCAAVLRGTAAYVRSGKRPNQVDRHTADVLDMNASQIERAAHQPPAEERE